MKRACACLPTAGLTPCVCPPPVPLKRERMSNPPMPGIGLGDRPYDPSLYTDEVDFNFFDGVSPRPLTPPYPPLAMPNKDPKTATPEPTLDLPGDEPGRLRLPRSEPLNTTPRLTPRTLPGSHFNLDLLVSSLNEVKNARGPGDGDRIFDLSESSEEEGGGGGIYSDSYDESSEEEYEEAGSESDGDITEVTPMSSLGSSPMPPPEESTTGWRPSRGSSPHTYGYDPINGFRYPLVGELGEMGWGVGRAGARRSVDSGVEDGSPLPPTEDSARSSESGHGSFRNCRDDPELMGSASRYGLPRLGTRRSRTPRKVNKTFKVEEAKRIERNNERLLERLIDTAQERRRPSGTTDSAIGRVKHVAPAAVFRKRNIKRIEHDNQILMKRLRAVKPSKEIAEAFGLKK